MSKPKILIQLDTDSEPSVFDSVVAIDAGVQHVLRYGGVTPKNVRDRVHGAIFTRGPQDLHSTALFVGGSDVESGEAVLAEIQKTFFGPMRVSVMLDPSGANTTAAAAVIAAARHVPLRGATALVLAATGPVGRRLVRLLAGQGANLRAGSRSVERARAVCDDVARHAVASRPGGVSVEPYGTATGDESRGAFENVQVVIAAGAAGVELAPEAMWSAAKELRVAIDLNAVPPVGLGGVQITDRAEQRGNVTCYGAIGVGASKMKIHKAAIRRLFDSNNQVLDAEQLVEIGKDLE